VSKSLATGGVDSAERLFERCAVSAWPTERFQSKENGPHGNSADIGPLFTPLMHPSDKAVAAKPVIETRGFGSGSVLTADSPFQSCSTLLRRHAGSAQAAEVERTETRGGSHAAFASIPCRRSAVDLPDEFHLRAASSMPGLAWTPKLGHPSRIAQRPGPPRSDPDRRSCSGPRIHPLSPAISARASIDAGDAADRHAALIRGADRGRGRSLSSFKETIAGPRGIDLWIFWRWNALCAPAQRRACNSLASHLSRRADP